MNAVRAVRGRAMPLGRRDVDTDQIIPAHWLKRTERTGYGAGLFEAWRRDPAFVLNDTRYAGAPILLAGANFGCGSSREHAVWALQEHGFAAVIAPSFGEIFRTNSANVGFVTVALPERTVARLIRAVEGDPSTEIEIDVEDLAVRAIGEEHRFALDPHAQRRLLQGLDLIGLTLLHEPDIARHERTRSDLLPRLRP